MESAWRGGLRRQWTVELLVILPLLCTLSKANLDLSDLGYSNLGGKGPDFWQKFGIRYNEAIHNGNKPLDLVIVTETDYKPHNSSLNTNFGVDQQMSRINVEDGSRVDLRFKFVRSGTHTEAAVPEFALTVFINSSHLKVRMYEFDHYCLFPDTSLTYTIVDEPRSVEFTLQESAASVGDPDDPQSLEKSEEGIAVTFFFRNVSSFPLGFYSSKAQSGGGGPLTSNFVYTGAASAPTVDCFAWGKPTPAARGPEAEPAEGAREEVHSSSSAGSTTPQVTIVEQGTHNCTGGEDQVPAYREVSHTGPNTTCVSVGWRPVKDQATCENAARWLNLSDTIIDTSLDPGRPEGCYILRDQAGLTLWLSRNPANEGNGAETTDLAKGMIRHPICMEPPAEGWTEDKVAWCCERHQVMCQWTTTRTATLDPAVFKAVTTTLNLTGFDCSAEWRAWTTPQRNWCCSTTGRGCMTPCDSGCVEQGINASCRDRIEWSRKNTYKDEDNPCQVAHDRVLVECSGCGQCATDDVCNFPTTTSVATTATSTTTITTSVTSTTTEPYDCQAGSSNWQKDWSSQKKTWCCLHHSMGCTSTITTTASSTTVAATTTTTLTSAASTETVTARPPNTTTTPATNQTGNPHDCHHPADSATWPQPKKQWCCKHETVGCPTTTTITSACLIDAIDDWGAAETGWCCEQRGLGCPTATATATPSSSSSSSTSTASAAAPSTSGVVTTTAPTTTARPATSSSAAGDGWDCQAGLSNWQIGWSDAKIDWCCQHHSLGCRTGRTSTGYRYDCGAGFLNYKKLWSAAKQEWCCRMELLGCSTTAVGSYNCQAALANWEAAWSSEKKGWCCKHWEVGCVSPDATTTSEPYDCTAGFSNWQLGWSQMKKTWCCLQYNRGCSRNTTSSEPFDCHAQSADTVLGWSRWRRVWCCKHHARGCPLTLAAASGFNCQAGLAKWQDHWSQEKKDWCCSHEGLGCSARLASIEAKAEQFPLRMPSIVDRGRKLAVPAAAALVGLFLGLMAVRLAFRGSGASAAPPGRAGRSRTLSRRDIEGSTYAPVGLDQDESLAHVFLPMAESG